MKLGDIPSIDEIDMAAVLLVLANYVEASNSTTFTIQKVKRLLIKHLNARRDSEYLGRAKELADKLLHILVDLSILKLKYVVYVPSPQGIIPKTPDPMSYTVLPAAELRKLANGS